MIDLTSVPPNTLLTTRQTAEVLSVPDRTLNVWRCRKTVNLPYVKLGANVRYRAGDILAFLEANTNAA